MDPENRRPTEEPKLEPAAPEPMRRVRIDADSPAVEGPTMQDLGEAVVRTVATMDELAAEVVSLKKRVAKADRQALMIYGVLAVILFKLSGAKTPSIKLPPLEVVDVS